MARECEQCGSRRFRKDAATGMAVCEEGHVVQGFRSEAMVQEMTQHVLQKRTIKRGPRRNKRKERGDRNLEYYHGSDADYLKHQALQLMLRLQVQALQQLWQLPSVIEAIARDLWAIQLSSHPLGLPPTAKTRSNSPFEAMANLSVNSPSGSRRGSRRGTPANSDSSGVSSDSEPDSIQDNIDPELLEQLSASEGERTEGESKEKEGAQAERKSEGRSLRAVDAVATLVVALWILRVPVLNVDIQALIEECKIPYIDFGHTKHLPSELKSHLNRSSMLALSPSQAPRPIYLYNACLKLARVAKHVHGIQIPESNASPIIWRCVSTLGGTPFTYHQTTRLLAHLDINLSLTVPLQIFPRRPPKRKDENGEVALPVVYRDLVLPELSAVCAMIMVVKIRYGLDGVARLGDNDEMPLPAERPWMDAIRWHVEQKTFVARSKLLDEIDFAHEKLDGIDSLLDQCEDVLLGHRDVAEDSMFPIKSKSTLYQQPQSPPHPDWSSVYNQDHATDQVPKLRSGRNYLSYDAKDYLGELPCDLDYLVQAAAQIIGVTSQDILERLEVMERRLKGRKRTLARRASSCSRR